MIVSKISLNTTLNYNRQKTGKFNTLTSTKIPPISKVLPPYNINNNLVNNNSTPYNKIHPNKTTSRSISWTTNSKKKKKKNSKNTEKNTKLKNSSRPGKKTKITESKKCYKANKYSKTISTRQKEDMFSNNKTNFQKSTPYQTYNQINPYNNNKIQKITITNTEKLNTNLQKLNSNTL